MSEIIGFIPEPSPTTTFQGESVDSKTGLIGFRAHTPEEVDAFHNEELLKKSDKQADLLAEQVKAQEGAKKHIPTCKVGTYLENDQGDFKVKAKGDEQIGIEIVCRALEAPSRQIVQNCGVVGSVIADEVLQKETNIGYNANNGEYVDMFKAGIIDPAKVVISALSNAASIAALMLTTQVCVTRTDDLEGGKKAKVEGSVR